MINIPELITKQRIKFLAKKENKEKIIEYLLKCPNIKEALNYLDVKYLNGLDLAVYEMPIEGYINLYDYICFYYSSNGCTIVIPSKLMV